MTGDRRGLADRKENYQIKLDKLTDEIIASTNRPRLLLQSCCAPCSSYVLEYLIQYFSITVFYYNPNIFPESEFKKRADEQKRFLKEMKFGEANLFIPPYAPDEFYSVVKGLEDNPEGGQRCEACFRLRMEKTAQFAAKNGFGYFGTTLTVSPHKNAQVINEIGEELGAKYGIKWLPSDFKKREGYKRSIQLSKEYGLYRQNWCGCEYSRRHLSDD
jgi:predicted adenine nucleotide alpha hydrolase (AANH) superfamily ATPase